MKGQSAQGDRASVRARRRKKQVQMRKVKERPRKVDDKKDRYGCEARYLEGEGVMRGKKGT